MREVVQTIQFFVAPVVMVSACGQLCFALHNRLTPSVVRLRTIAKEEVDTLARLSVAVLVLALAGCGARTSPSATGVAAAPQSATTAAAPDSGCSADRPCSGGAPCIAQFLDRMNCGPAGCREMALACYSDANCEPGWRCSQGGAPSPVERGQCVQRTCQAESDCADPNHQCGPGGVCTPKTCQRDADCPGFCLSTMNAAEGHCWHSRGQCSSFAPRP